jgi:ferredoxin-nitrite reductase
MSENMYIRNLKLSKANELLALTKEVRQVLPVQMSVSCIGVPTCQVGIEQSQALCKLILEKLKNNEIPSDYLPAMHISGCSNSCTRHQVNVLGFAGGKKRVGDAVVDGFELYAGGRAGINTGFGKSYGFLKQEEIPDFITVLAIELNELKLKLPDYIISYPREFEALVNSYLT